MAFKLAPAYKYDITVQQEFCEHFSIHYIFYTNGFCESNTSSKNIYLGQEIYSEYNHNQNGAVINVEFNLIGNGKKSVYIRCPTRSGGLIVLRNAYECYIYFNCSQNANTAVNWKNDTNLIPQQPQANFSQLQYPNTYLAPTFDLYRYFNETKVNHSLNLKSLIPGYLIQRMAHYFSEKNNMPESTLILVGLGVFSGLTCRKWNCAYPDGETAPICLYVAAEQNASNGKTPVLNAFQKPLITMIEKEIEKIDAIILTQQENLKAHLDTEIDIEKENRNRFKVQTKKLEKEIEELKEKKKKANHIMPKTNITKQALEESLNHTNGFFIATADEQSLIDSLISGKGNTSNEILLKGRNAERIQSVRISREGYSGKVTGSFVCFSQSGCIEKIIKASGVTGLCERFLMISEPEFTNKDHLKNIPFPSELFSEYNDRFRFLKNLIDKPLPHSKLTTLKISDTGWNAINEYNNKLENLILSNQIFYHEILKGMAKKSTLHIMSIASNLHLSECIELPLSEADHYIENRFVYAAIEIFNALLYSAKDYLERNGYLSNKDELRSILDYFIGTDGYYKRVKVNIHSLEGRKNLGSGKRQLIKDTINFLLNTNNLIEYQDGTTGLNPMIRHL